MSVALDNPAPRPVAGRCRLAINALHLTLFVIGLQIAWSLVGIALMGGLIDVAHDWTFFDMMNLLMTGFYLFCLLVSAVLFIRWQRSMTHNLRLLGAGGFDPGVSLSSWSWFVPIVNLFMPYRSMAQIARFSVAEGEQPSSALVGWWWAAWLLANLSGPAVNGLYNIADTPQDWITAATMDVTCSTVLIVTGLLATQMLSRLTGQQQARLRALVGADDSSPVDLVLS